MLLQKLKEYYGTVPALPPMYQNMRVPWLIDLDEKGNFNGVIRTSDETQPNGKRKKTKDRGKTYLTPDILRSGNAIRAKLIVDRGDYVLGLPRKEGDEERAKKCHQDFVEKVQQCYVDTGEPSLGAVINFLNSIKNLPADQIKEKLSLSEDFNPADVMSFQVNGTLPFQQDTVKEWWAQNALEEDEGREQMQCIVCGEQKTPERRLQVKIKGVPGGQTSGMAIISANENVFESYGLKESLIAPICRECAEATHNAVNALLKDQTTSIKVGSMAYIFWTKQKTKFSAASFLSDPDPEDVKSLIESAWKGKKAALDVVDINEFYAAAFSPSGGRLAVREWLDTTVGKAKENLARYFILQQITGLYGEEPSPIKLYALAAATERDAGDINARTTQTLIGNALKGEPFPDWLLYKAIQRNRAEQSITRPRAALIKMALLSKQKYQVKEDYMVKLETENKSPAYLCGRLFAVLEDIQRAAIPGAGSTITDKYFGTASSAPASVFGNLLRTAQHHLGKLRKEKEGAYYGLNKRLEEVLGELTEFPKTLSLEEQGYFSLGYYHQRAHDRAERTSKGKPKEEAS
ncbi:MAG: type I-C CRISPR-associated protein Cas8c/Csd1 [Deltaproteobacteria bacterium]|nr:type I-C CRISPR-associated protein Cas8c/Csd1 [Deltaproteobacteria bacterium]